MQLDLITFETQTEEAILQRGQKYFKEGNVTNLEELVKNHWYAEVAGTDVYEIELTLAGTKVKHYECSCPYDLGPVCKHVVAVMYAIIANKNKSGKGQPSKTNRLQEKTPTKKSMLLEILDNVSYPDLKAFLLEYALKKNEFGGILLARFAHQTGHEGKDKYLLIIKNATKAAGNRVRFIQYEQVPGVMKPVKELLHQAQNFFAQKYYTEVVNICQAVIEEISELIQQMDDSAGLGGNAIEQGFNLLLQLSEDSIPLPLQETLFAYALGEADKQKYRYNGSYIFWYELLDKLATDKSREDQVIALVESKINQQAAKENASAKNDQIFQNIFNQFFADNYDEKELAMFLVKFYLIRKRQPEANQVIQKYRHISQFREILITQALQAKQYQEAKQQIQEAQKLNQQNKFGQHNNHWDQWLLTIAEAEQNLADIRTIAAALFYRTYKLEYYRKYKQTYPPEAWPAEYNNVVANILKENKRFGDSYQPIVPVFIEEQDWEKLFEHVQKHSSLELLMEVSPYLEKTYTKDLLVLFQNTLFDFADKNVNKSSYKFVVRALQYLLTLEGGKPIVTGLLTDFRELFKKRRTMIAELDKVKV